MSTDFPADHAAHYEWLEAVHYSLAAADQITEKK
jgi:hypothetical protein